MSALLPHLPSLPETHLEDRASRAKRVRWRGRAQLMTSLDLDRALWFCPFPLSKGLTRGQSQLSTTGVHLLQDKGT